MIPHSRDENTSWSLPGALLLRPLTSMKPRVMVAYQICLVQNNHVISWDPLFHAKDTRDWTPSSSYEGHMQMTKFRVPAGSFPPPHPCDEDVDTRAVGIWERLLAARRGGSHRHVPPTTSDGDVTTQPKGSTHCLPVLRSSSLNPISCVLLIRSTRDTLAFFSEVWIVYCGIGTSSLTELGVE
ncbi:hypothetical protein GW17_00039013 [Ensete ventricosum]|nr:hypothetical protein GW17_00039013 [Ensete ventricosum]